MTDVTAPAPRPGWLAFLPGFLFDTTGSRFAYVGKAWLLSLLPSIALAMIVGSLAPEAAGPDLPVNGPLMLFMLVVFAPVLETLLMTPPLLLLNRLIGPVPAVIANAIGWGVLHSLSAPTWGLVTWWPFLIFSIALLTWRRHGILMAMAIVASIHAMQNGTVALFMIAAGG